MNLTAVHANRRKLLIMVCLVLLCAAAYLLVEVQFDNARLFQYAMKIRTPKLIVMLITAFAIGGASIVFQSIINNTIVTPCLLGMNSLYTSLPVRYSLPRVYCAYWLPSWAALVRYSTALAVSFGTFFPSRYSFPSR